MKPALAEILIVDDTPANLEILNRFFSQNAYKARTLPSGKMALRSAKMNPPDLFLLDINMPEMNGYELCEHLKADPQLRDIPVIFLSALDDADDKVKAFDCGGVDYITKPFEFKEVLSRVQTHLKINKLQQLLNQRNHELAQRLQEVETLVQLRDNLAQMIVHDMRTPLTGIIGYLSLLQIHDKQIPPNLHPYVDSAEHSSQVLLDMINNLLDISKLEAGQKLVLNKTQTPLQEIVQLSIQDLGAYSEHEILLDLPEDQLEMLLDQDLIRRIITNLVSNACKYGGKKSIKIQIHLHPNQVWISISDQGPGIRQEDQDKIFEKFIQLESAQQRKFNSTGLGLTFCKMAAQAHGGDIHLESQPGQGSCFSLILSQ